MCSKLAREVATGNLCPTNPIRLALVLNVSGFFYHLLRSPERYTIMRFFTCSYEITPGLVVELS
jgi:hypothetical protein